MTTDSTPQKLGARQDPERWRSLAQVDREIEGSPWVVHEPTRFSLKAFHAHLKELDRSRSLIRVLVQRELKARYRGSLLGFGWTLLNPLALLAVYSLVFSVYMRIEIEDYPLYLLSGLLPWLWLSQSLASGANSIIDGSTLVTRVMLPPQLLPIVEVVSNGFNFLFGLPLILLLIGLLRGLDLVPLITLPLVALFQGLFLVGILLPLAAATVMFRDVKFLVQNLVTFWFFLTPIVYTPDLVPENLRVMLELNPFFPFAHAYQMLLYDGSFPSPTAFMHMGGMAVLACLFGILIFERLRERMVEEL